MDSDDRTQPEDATGLARLFRQYLPAVAAQSTSRALGMLANVLSLLLIARVLGSEIFGQFSYVMAFLAIALAVADLNTASVLAWGIGRQQESALAIFLGNFIMIRAATTIAAVVAAVGFALFINPDLRSELLLCAFAIPVLSSRVFDLIYQVHGKPWYAAQVNLIYSSTHIAVALITILWMQGPLIAYLWAWIACNVLYTVVAVGLALRLVVPRFHPTRNRLKEIFALAAPLGVGTVFSIINGRADTFMLAYLRTLEEVAYYNAVYRLLDFGALATLTILAPLIPIMARALIEHRDIARHTGEQLVEVAAMLTLPVAICVPYVSWHAIDLLYGQEYAPAADVLPIFGWLFVIAVYCLIGATLNLAAGQVTHAYWNTALAVVINISLNLVLIPKYGFIGAAWATVVSHLSMLAVSQYFVARNIGWLLRPDRWVRICGLNVGLYLLLEVSWRTGGLLAMSGCLALYGLLAHRMRLIPVEAVLTRLRERRAPS